jgi:hypothetical protein
MSCGRTRNLTTPQAQVDDGPTRMACMPTVNLPIPHVRQFCTVVRPTGLTVYYMTLSFALKTQAKIAKSRILEDYSGAYGPPCTVGFASIFRLSGYGRPGPSPRGIPLLRALTLRLLH